MAEVIETVHTVTHYLQNVAQVVVDWDNLSINDSGRYIGFSEFADRSVHIFGIIGGATVIIEGSNEIKNPTNWFTFTGSGGTLLSLTAIGIGHIILESGMWLRPRIVGGSGTTNVSVRLYARRNIYR